MQITGFAAFLFTTDLWADQCFWEHISPSSLPVGLVRKNFQDFSLSVSVVSLYIFGLFRQFWVFLFHNLNLDPLAIRNLSCVIKSIQSVTSEMGCNFQSLCAVKFWQFCQLKPFVSAFSQHFITHLQWQMLWFNY